MSYKCECGKELADLRGARGHFQFSTGAPHGEKGSVPDGWREHLSELDGEDDDEPADEDDEDTTESSGGSESRSGSSEKGRLRRALTEDVRALWGGDE